MRTYLWVICTAAIGIMAVSVPETATPPRRPVKQAADSTATTLIFLVTSASGTLTERMRTAYSCYHSFQGLKKQGYTFGAREEEFFRKLEEDNRTGFRQLTSFGGLSTEGGWKQRTIDDLLLLSGDELDRIASYGLLLHNNKIKLNQIERFERDAQRIRINENR